MSQASTTLIDYASLDVDSATLIEIAAQHPRLFGARAASGRPHGVHLPRGWGSVFRRLCAALDVRIWSAAIDALVTGFELESERTCEACGQPTRPVTDSTGWVRTLLPSG